MRLVCMFLLCIACIASMAATPAPVSAEEQELSTRDFAYGYMLNVRQEGAVYSVVLPDKVYKSVRRADLGDIRVFNGAGEVVPHTVRQLETDERAAQVVEEIPLFPLYEQQQAVQGNSLSLNIVKDSNGTIIDIDNRQVVPGTSPSGYLLDLGSLKKEPGSLEIFWQADPKSATAAVSLQKSNDLQRWTTLVHRTTLVDLQFEGNRVVQRRISLPGNLQKYLKISWSSDKPPLMLTRVNGVSRPLVSRIDHRWVSLYNGEIGKSDDTTAVTYSSHYRLPVKSVKVRFPEPNSIISGEIQSRPGDEALWRARCRGVFYSLQVTGEQFTSEPCSFTSTTDRQWRIVLHQDGAGLAGGKKVPVLELGWSSGELLFVARGASPYILAYGSADSGKLENAKMKRMPKADMILQAIRHENSEQLVQKAMLGKHLELSGDAALIPPPAAKPWKTWTLWGVLVLGVGLMGWMARSLFKDLSNLGREKRDK